MMAREPVLISTVTAIPGERLTEVLLDLHLRAVERDARRVDEFLPFGSLDVAVAPASDRRIGPAACRG